MALLAAAFARDAPRSAAPYAFSTGYCTSLTVFGSC